MAVQFQHVFPRKGVGRLEIKRDALVDGLAGSVLEVCERRVSRHRSLAQHCIGNGADPVSGNPDDADPASAGRCRYRGNGVFPDAVGTGHHRHSARLLAGLDLPGHEPLLQDR